MTEGKQSPYKCILLFSPVETSLVAVGEARKIESLMNGRSVVTINDTSAWLVLRTKEASEGLYEAWRKFVDSRLREGRKFWIVYNAKRICLADSRGNCLNGEEWDFLYAGSRRKNRLAA